MSRESNLINLLEDTPLDQLCPTCRSADSTRARSRKDGNVNDYVIDIFSSQWLQCTDCGTVWKRAKGTLDEDRERNSEDSSL